MTEGQRVKLEEYLDDFEVAVTNRTYYKLNLTFNYLLIFLLKTYYN